MIKSLSLLSATILFASAASPSLASSLTFTQDGISYVAEVEQLDNGLTKISGMETVSRKPFTLVVRGNTVKGDYAGTAVKFQTKQTPATELSSR
jgi:hypothetical protein